MAWPADRASAPADRTLHRWFFSLAVNCLNYACPSDPGLRAEVERALYQRDLYEEQREAALDWLASHDFDIDAQDIDGDALARFDRSEFDRRLASAFPSSAVGKHNPPTPAAATANSPSVAAEPQQPPPVHNQGSGIAGKEKTWRANAGAKLTTSQTAVLEAMNELFPDGKVDHKARARDKRIAAQLKDKSSVSTRTIQRTLKKIHFA
jgi:hypothetical protein